MTTFQRFWLDNGFTLTRQSPERIFTHSQRTGGEVTERVITVIAWSVA